MQMNNDIDMTRIPRHIAIIMDGNGRWARSRGLERFLGHRKGTQATIDAVEVGVNLKLEHMTLYVFSSENWGRPSKEVDYLMNLLIEMVVKEIPDLMEKNVKLKVIGNMERLPEKPRASLQSAIDKTANNTGMQLNPAISYGGRQEIVDATKAIAAQVAAGTLKAEDIDFATNAEENITCSYNGTPMSIGFKGSSMIEILNNLDGDEIIIELADPSRAGVIVPAQQPENEEVLMLIMPMLLND